MKIKQNNNIINYKTNIVTPVVEFWGQGSTMSTFLLKNLFTDFQTGCQKVPKSDFQSQKSSESFWYIFSISLGAQFLVLTFLDNFDIWNTKMMPNLMIFLKFSVGKIRIKIILF